MKCFSIHQQRLALRPDLIQIIGAISRQSTFNREAVDREAVGYRSAREGMQVRHGWDAFFTACAGTEAHARN